MTRSLLRRAAPALAALLAAGTLAVTGPAVSPASAATTSAKPVVGECRDLTLGDVFKKSNSTAPVDCTAAHTSVVVAVGKLPRRLTWKSPATKLVAAVTKTCQRGYVDVLDRPVKVRERTAYEWFWFRPSAAQRAAGARWFRCDVALIANHDLAALPTDGTALIASNPPADDVARCLTGRNLAITTCSRGHTYRAVGAFTIASKKFPGARAIGRAAAKRCTALGAPRGRYSYRPDPIWSTGEHAVVCYRKTRS